MPAARPPTTASDSTPPPAAATRMCATTARRTARDLLGITERHAPLHDHVQLAPHFRGQRDHGPVSAEPVLPLRGGPPERDCGRLALTEPKGDEAEGTTKPT